MRSFDEERRGRAKSGAERTFELGGETFMVKAAVRPESLSGFDELQKLGPNPSIGVVMDLTDKIMLQLLVGGDSAAEKWNRVRANEDDAIDSKTLQDVMEWAVEIATGVPTQRLSGSTPLSAETGNGSMGDSSLPDLQAVPTA